MLTPLSAVAVPAVEIVLAAVVVVVVLVAETLVGASVAFVPIAVAWYMLLGNA